MLLINQCVVDEDAGGNDYGTCSYGRTKVLQESRTRRMGEVGVTVDGNLGARSEKSRLVVCIKRLHFETKCNSRGRKLGVGGNK